MPERLADMAMRIKVTDMRLIRSGPDMHVFKWKDSSREWDVLVDLGFPIDPQKSFNVHCGTVGKLVDDSWVTRYPIVVVCTSRFGQVTPLKAFLFMNNNFMSPSGMGQMIKEMVELSHG